MKSQDHDIVGMASSAKNTARACECRIFFIQIPLSKVSSKVELVTNDQHCGWCEALYEAKAADLILYGRALGLSHGEAEDVLQETFVALMQRTEAPSKPEHY